MSNAIRSPLRTALLKLEALWRNVTSFLPADLRAQYFDPLAATEFFARYAPLRDTVRAENPDLFGDVPLRDISPSQTTDFEGRGYITRHQLEQLMRDITYILDVAAKGLEAEPPPLTVTREGVFFTGQQYDALRRISEILAPARSRILIVDAYVNESVLDLLTSKGPGVEVRILTKIVSPALGVTAHKFKEQYGGLSIRVSEAFHDRFVVVDDHDYYHFGASIKDAGNRGFMFSKIEEPAIIAALSKELSGEWERASVVL